MGWMKYKSKALTTLRRSEWTKSVRQVIRTITKPMAEDARAFCFHVGKYLFELNRRPMGMDRMSRLT